MTISPDQILLHVRTYLPTVTDLFSNTLSAIGVSEGNVVVFTAADHGLRAGSKIGISSGITNNPILSIDDNLDGTARFQTEYEHDLTEKKDRNDPDDLVLSGVSDAWNGSHKIFSIPNRYTFEVEIPEGESVPAAAGFLSEDRSAGISGVHEIVAADKNTFTVNFDNVPSFPDGNISDVNIVSGYRIWAAASIKRAEELYTKQAAGKYALFLIMGDVNISKDRHSLNDGVGTFTKANDARQTVLENFSLVAFLPTDDDDISGAKAQNMAYSGVYKAINSVIYGQRIYDPESSIQFLMVNNGHGPGIENTAYLTHIYDWQAPSVITADISKNLEPNVAFRDIQQTITGFSDDVELKINLDDEPI